MGKDYSICVGAVGFGGGVWYSPDTGETWNRIRDPFVLGAQVRALAVYPDNPSRILAGSDQGIFRSRNIHLGLRQGLHQTRHRVVVQMRQHLPRRHWLPLRYRQFAQRALRLETHRLGVRENQTPIDRNRNHQVVPLHRDQLLVLCQGPIIRLRHQQVAPVGPSRRSPKKNQ